MSGMRSDVPTRQVQLHPEFLAAVQDAESYEAAMACAKGQGWPASTVINANISQVIQAIGRNRPPTIVMVDVDELADAAGQLAQLVKLCGTRSRVLAIGSANDVPFYRSIIQAGAADYLVKPLNSVVLRDFIVPLLAAKNSSDTSNAQEKREGEMFVIVGMRGGVGATTISVNMSWTLAHQLDRKVALLDLDLQFGNCALALDLEPGRGLREVLSSPDRVDSLLINSSMAKESENLAVFSCEESLEEMVEFDTGGAIALIKEMRKDYDQIIVDLPRSLVGRHRRLLGTANQIILVTDLTLTGIRDTARVMSAIQNLGVSAPIHIVAARIGDGEAQVNRSTFERGVQGKISALIPHDPVSMKLSANRGKAAVEVAADTELASRLISLTRKLVGADEPADKAAATGIGGMLSSFLKKKG